MTRDKDDPNNLVPLAKVKEQGLWDGATILVTLKDGIPQRCILRIIERENGMCNVAVEPILE